MTEMTKIAGVETPIEVARLINALVDNKGNIDLDNLSETGLAKFTNLDTKITNVQENVNALTTTVNEKIGATVSKAQNGYIKFTNGVIIQWGAFSINNVAISIIHFPISFQTDYIVIANDVGAGRICYASGKRDNGSFLLYSPISERIGGYYFSIGY